MPILFWARRPQVPDSVFFFLSGVAAGAALVFFRLKRAYGRPKAKPFVLWFTGLPGSGKTTVSERLVAELRKLGVPVEHLDGDSIRKVFPATGFSREDREAHIKRVGFLASKLERNGVFVVTSLISPYEESRRFVRGLCQNFLEIYLSTPLDECERRDPKGLYKKAREGSIRNFTGVDDPYEAPAAPDLTFDTRAVSADEAVKRILERVKKGS